MKSFSGTITPGILLLAVAGMAFAQRPGQPMPRLALQALDLNHDGILEANEIQAAPKSLLSLDRNGDGRITADEVSQRPTNAGASSSDLAGQMMQFDKDHKGYLVASDLPERMRGIFERGDTNHDGKLTAEELQALGNKQAGASGPADRKRGGEGPFRFDPILAALDTNHDGELSADEIAAASTSLLTLDKNGNGQIDADEMQMHQMNPQERLHHFMEEFDTNKDGRIARDEAPERMVTSGEFDRIDVNHDGFMDKDELVTFFTQMDNQQGPDGPHHD